MQACELLLSDPLTFPGRKVSVLPRDIPQYLETSRGPQKACLRQNAARGLRVGAPASPSAFSQVPGRFGGECGGPGQRFRERSAESGAQETGRADSGRSRVLLGSGKGAHWSFL